MDFPRALRILRAILLWLPALPVILVLPYAGFWADNEADTDRTPAVASMPEYPCPAVPRNHAAPLYTAPNGKHKGDMTWWEYFDPADIQEGWLQLEEIDSTPTVERLGKEVGNWVRSADLSFDLQDVARLDAQLTAKQRVNEKLTLADWNGDGRLELLKIERLDNIFDEWDRATMYGTPQGIPTIYLDLKSPNISKIRMPNGAMVFSTKQSLWNGMAYCWQDGRYRYCQFNQGQKRQELVSEYWGKVRSLRIPTSDYGSSTWDYIIPHYLSIWLIIFCAPWFSSAAPRRKIILIVLGLILITLPPICWYDYRYNGYQDGASSSMLTSASAWLATLVIFSIVCLKRKRDVKADNTP